MDRQKRIAVINDISGFGRCSVTVAQPIISAMKIQCCALPTAIFSSHTGFPGYIFNDYTDNMVPYMKHWEKIGIEFDGIGTGFLGSKQQIQIVIDFIKKFKNDKTIILVDPIMGDYGKLYPTYTDEMCIEMKRLIEYADVLTPNLTEACRLLDMQYPKRKLSLSELKNIAVNLSRKGPDRIVITGIQNEDNIINFVYNPDQSFEVLEVAKIGEYRSGTGDIFSAIVIADLVNGKSFHDAVKKAVDFITKSIKYTNDLKTPLNFGLCFEEYVHELAE